MLRRSRNRGQSASNHRARSQNAGRNQTFSSHGPNIHVRGNAAQVFERYQNLAREAQTSGDRIIAESYFQHAEHYYRICHSMPEAEMDVNRSSSSAALRPGMTGGKKSHSGHQSPSGNQETHPSKTEAVRASATNEVAAADQEIGMTISADSSQDQEEPSEEAPQWLHRSVSRSSARNRSSRKVHKRDLSEKSSPPEGQAESRD